MIKLHEVYDNMGFKKLTLALFLIGMFMIVASTASATLYDYDDCEVGEGGGTCSIPIEINKKQDSINPNGSLLIDVKMRNTLKSGFDRTVELERVNSNTIITPTETDNYKSANQVQELNYKDKINVVNFELPDDFDASKYDAVKIDVYNPVEVKRNVHPDWNINHHAVDYGLTKNFTFFTKRKTLKYRHNVPLGGRFNLEPEDQYDYSSVGILKSGHGYDKVGSFFYNFENPGFYVENKYKMIWETGHEEPDIDFLNTEDITAVAHFKKFENLSRDKTASLGDSTRDIYVEEGKTAYRDQQLLFPNSEVLEECSEEFSKGESCSTEIVYSSDSPTKFILDYGEIGRLSVNRDMGITITGAVTDSESSSDPNTGAVYFAIGVGVFVILYVIFRMRRGGK